MGGQPGGDLMNEESKIDSIAAQKVTNSLFSENQAVSYMPSVLKLSTKNLEYS